MRRHYQEKRSGGLFKIVVVLIIIFLLWGFIGAKQVEKSGLPCKIGYKDKFCWSWEKPLIEKGKNITKEINDSLSNP